MMFEAQIKSKVYVVPKKNNTLIVIVAICVIITAILGIISIINSGVKIGNVSPIIMSLAVGIGVFEKSSVKPYYEFDIATIVISDQLEITYQNSKLQVCFNIHEITSLQYSDQLKCLRLVGNYTKKENNKETSFLNNEYLLYVDDNEEKSVIEELENQTQLMVQYMDR